MDASPLHPEPTIQAIPPLGVEIPNTSIYGSNEKLDNPPTDATNEAKINENKANEESSPNPKSQQQSLKVKFGPFLIITATLLIGSFSLGYFISFRTKTGNATENNPSTQNAKSPANKQRTGFAPDKGIYKRANVINAAELSKTRIDGAKTKILWVTDSPDSIYTLPLLASKKNTDSIPIFILTGKETPLDRLNAAPQYNIPINRINTELEGPYSFLLIDNKLLVDISRTNWVWETTEPNILTEVQTWIKDLIESEKNNDNSYQTVSEQ